jgi:hypothetical protein
MEECSGDHNVASPTHRQTKRLSLPGERPFDFPPALLVLRLPSVLHRWLLPFMAMQTDQLDPSVALTFAPCIRVRQLLGIG